MKLPAHKCVDAKPGRQRVSQKSRLGDAIDMSHLPAMDSKDVDVLSDPMQEGTERHRQAQQHMHEMINEIRRKKGLPPNEEWGKR